MNRRELLAACSGMTAFGAAGCNELRRGDSTAGDGGGSTAGERLAAADVRDWPTFLYDGTNRRCFASDRVTADAPSTQWSYGTDDAIWASPVVADGRLYVGSYDEHLYALSAEDGELLWRYRAGDRIDGSPAVANGTVYVGSFDRNIYALDAETGEERWIYGTKGIVRSSPTVHDGVVYVGAHCHNTECTGYYDVEWPETGAVYALDAETGDLRWRHGTDDGVLSTPALDGDTAFVGSSDNTLYALDAATGETRWRYDAGESVVTSPTCVDGRVYFGNVAGEVYALDAGSGDLEWQFDAERFAGDTIHSVVITGSPVVCGGTVYVGSTVPSTDGTYGKLYAVSAADGTRQWSASPFAQSIGSSPAVVNDVVYFGAHTLGPSSDVEVGVYALGDEGDERWSHTVAGADHRGFGSSPAIVDATLYIGGTDGTVHAFDME